MDNVFSRIPSNLPNELVEQLQGAESVWIERIVSHGHASPAGFWYDEAENEWVVVLQGACRLQFEDEVLELRPGDFLNIPAHRRHRVEWTTPDEPTVWLSVSYQERRLVRSVYDSIRCLDWAGIALLIVALVTLYFDLLMASFLEPRGDGTEAFILGAAFAQMTVFAVWTALAPTRMPTRIASGLGLAVLVALALFRCLDRSWPGPEGLVVTGAALVLWPVLQIPLWILRRRFGWRLYWPTETADRPGVDEVQFGVRQLLAWTAVVAVSLALGRWLIPDNFPDLGQDPRESLAVFAVLGLSNAVLPLPVVWAAFVSRWMVLWIIAAAICYRLVTLAEIAVFTAVIGRGSDVDIFWTMNACQLMGAGAILLLARATGLRIDRRRVRS